MATKTIHLRESVKEAPIKKGERWRVVVARPGKGSSGNYSAEVLEKYASTIVPANAQSFLNHDFERNPKDMIGFYPEAAFWDKEEQAVVAELSLFSHWKDFVDEVGPHCGISLYAMGVLDDDDNVIEFMEDVYNGADLVSRPGLAGSGLDVKLYEAAHNAANSGTLNEDAQQRSDRKEIITMDEKDIKAIAEAVASAIAPVFTEALKPLVTAKTEEAQKAEQVEADEKAVSEALDAYEAAVKAIDSADLFDSQVEAIRAEAKAGKDVAPLIESAKRVKAEAVEAAGSASTSGRVVESATGKEVKFGYGARN